ncbi:MAG: DUF3160 domain-containing protein, partial [Acidimicrobiia bacterium]|nr:DUF3160 domain-containing protein [Acidimicrobiia bacterium]
MTLLVFLLLAAGCTSTSDPTTTLPPTTTITTATAVTTTTAAIATPTTLPPIVLPALDREPFAELVAVPLLAGESGYGGPGTPGSLTNVQVADWIDQYLKSNDAEAALLANGFVVIPGSTRHFHHIYEGAEYDAYPVFVTTDTAYHVWHLAFDKILREAEQQALLPILEDMLVRLVEIARSQEEELAGTTMAEEASRVAQFYEAAATVLELDVGEIGPLAQQEVALIMEATQATVSPTTGGNANSGFITTKVDYSLFK